MNYDEILKFNLDNNGFPKITKKNIKLINFIVKNDSNYRRDNDEFDKTSTLNLVKKLKKDYNRENLLEVITAIDIQNSTHLSVSGKEKGNNEGRKLTCDYIFKIPNLLDQIKNGNLFLVNDIAKHAISNRYVLSFASKFCSYVSRYLGYDDNYSIYDNILVNILPYYYYQYTKKILDTKIDRDNLKKQEDGYITYNNIIEEIIKKVKEKEHYDITRKDFDYLLWYYYKGDKDIKDENKNITHKSRTTTALETISKK